MMWTDCKSVAYTFYMGLASLVLEKIKFFFYGTV